MKYKHRYAVKLMCKVLKISESGYYRWLKNKDKPSKRHLLPVKINEILSEHPDNANYGYDRIHKALEIRGIKVSRNIVYRAMKDGNLIHKARKPHGITKASTEIQDKENLIKRDFTADKPVKKLLTDITEVQCLDGKLYISAIMDCYNGEILTVEMRDNMKKRIMHGYGVLVETEMWQFARSSITQRPRKSIHKRGISEIIKKLRNNTEFKRHRALL